MLRLTERFVASRLAFFGSTFARTELCLKGLQTRTRIQRG
jgi:hypothetical protein